MRNRIKKIDDDNFRIIQESDPEVVNVKDLEKQVKDLEKELQKQEPNSAELLAWAQANHPYYLDADELIRKIDDLNMFINELKGL